jgi:hypothetical protein
MKNLLLYLSFVLFLTTLNSAKIKSVEKHFSVKPFQMIELQNLGSSRIHIKAWDRNEIYVKLKFNFSSSDYDYESKVIRSFNIVSSEKDSILLIKQNRISSESSYSKFLGIKFRFGFYENSDIEGEIYVPRSNRLKCFQSYSTISLENMRNEIQFYGKGNTLSLTNCAFLRIIENDYGKTNIEKSSGNLFIKNKSGTVKISDHSGTLFIEGEYSNITLNKIKQKVVLNSKNAKHIITNLMSDLLVNSDYSAIEAENICGAATINDRSGNISVRNATSLDIKSDYTKVYAFSIIGNSEKQCKIKGTSGKVTLENSSAKIFIDNSFSDIILKNIKGDINLKGKSSTVYAEKISGKWESSSEYTRLTVKGFYGKYIKAANKGETIEFDLETVPSFVSIINELGAVKVSVPHGYSGIVNLSDRSGKIESNIALKTKETDNALIASGRLGLGHGKINIENKSGNITLIKK